MVIKYIFVARYFDHRKRRNIFFTYPICTLYNCQANLKMSFSLNNRLKTGADLVFAFHIHFIPRHVEQMSVRIQTFFIRTHVHNNVYTIQLYPSRLAQQSAFFYINECMKYLKSRENITKLIFLRRRSDYIVEQFNSVVGTR